MVTMIMILVMVVMMIIIMVLFRFVTITIIVRERERARESSTSLFVFRKGLPFFNSAACPGPSRSRRPRCLHFSLRTMLELKLKDQFVELVPLAIPGDPGHPGHPDDAKTRTTCSAMSHQLIPMGRVH